MERLQKFIAEAGIASRRKAEEMIAQGRVKVNNDIVTEQGIKVSDSDIVSVDGKRIKKKEKKEYYLLFKPRGVISSSSDEKERTTVIDLIDESNARLYPVGRLDYDTSGVIIITNDGEFANLLMHPSNKIKKTYVAMVDGLIDAQAMKNLEQGIILDGKKTAKAKAKIMNKDSKHNNSKVRLTITEGMYHQVKRMFEAVGFPVKKLHREMYGLINLNGLEPGQYRKLKTDEINDLKNLATGKPLEYK
ncbi:pseudouridine synthase [Mycoplasma sp. P36-A1]|uniref:pseudouridine synthase n=1 Tax=Mycoplasma sp. P36-A1 TaxID=3252900 RepID=UPI003C2DFA5C